jgi:hypothetical protein
MIPSMSSPDRSAAADAVVASSQTAGRFVRQQPDQISTQGAAYLRSALESQPEIRPEEVARGVALAADPNYPSAAIMKNIAGQILGAQDFSEDES